MKATQPAAIPALAAALASGCGTIVNFASGDPEIYGGPRKDIEFLQTPRSVQAAPNTPAGSSGSAGRGAAFVAAFVVADIPVSLVADTLTLPLAVYLRQHDSNAAR